MTINKSQGQSLSRVGLYLKYSIFTYGQLYVTLSRIKGRVGVKLLIFDRDVNVTNKITNVVYKEILQNYKLFIYFLNSNKIYVPRLFKFICNLCYLYI